ncbi:MAG: GntR family transcriptional regulator [Acidimicrobiia bacterium]
MATSPTYLELADRLEREFDHRRPGDRVASEHALAAEHRVSRPTARAALQELERRYLVRRVRGAGTFVNDRVTYCIGSSYPPSFSQTVRAAGATPHWSIVQSRHEPARGAVAADLALAPGADVIVLNRIGWIDDDIACFSTSYLPADVTQGLDTEVDSSGSLYETLRSYYGLQPQRRWSRASLELPDETTAEWLDLRQRAPMWLVEGVNVCTRLHRPIEKVRSWMRTDVVQVRFELGAP